MPDQIANDRKYIEAMQADDELRALRAQIYQAIAKYRYTYNFTWFGRPIIQLPEDIITLQELILQVRPDLIIETGVAHGGSLVFSASMLELLGQGEVVGVELEMRSHNRKAIESHPLSKRIRLVEGSSVDQHVVDQVRRFAEGKRAVLVILDSNHTHEHVLRELELYSPLVTKGSYLVVLDTGIEDMPEGTFADRPWDKGNNPKTAVWEFLKHTNRFEIDRALESRLLYTVAPDGYLKCIAD
ncbi:MAG TPA: cephalosporin hydroxylase family protein [Pyrinomonadaceae bacterium]|jgi:cephalosporin hydroxylase|nr:cephalosporin hydroxylase family protein [Pyrinomonadaceae bacterium]